jgi:sugar lactone lactonase YvrE
MQTDFMQVDGNIGFAIPTMQSCGDSCLFLLVGLDDRIIEVNFTEKKTLRTIASLKDVHTEGFRFFTGSCSPDGTLFAVYAGPRQPAHDCSSTGKGRIYTLNMFSELTPILRGEILTSPCGGAWFGSDTYFVVDGGTNRIYRYFLREKDGIKLLTDRKQVFKLANEDVEKGHSLGGLTIDMEGRLWVALSGAGSIIRVDVESQVSISVCLPARARVLIVI